jgi:hypothetical protein
VAVDSIIVFSFIVVVVVGDKVVLVVSVAALPMRVQSVRSGLGVLVAFVLIRAAVW